MPRRTDCRSIHYEARGMFLLSERTRLMFIEDVVISNSIVYYVGAEV